MCPTQASGSSEPQVQDTANCIFLSVTCTDGQLSLSRCNYRLPGREAHPEGVPGTAKRPSQIADARLPQAAPVWDAAAAFDPAGDRLPPYPTSVQGLRGPVRLTCQQRRAAWLLAWQAACDLGQRARP